MDVPEPREIKQTILIVDDAAMNRAILADMLGDDYHILEADNGLEAVAALQSHGTDISLVLLDVVMPEMDGFDVLAIMNKRGWINDIPVIMVTAESQESTASRAYMLGVTDFINRPFDTVVVRRRVLNTLMLKAKQQVLVDMVEEEILERERSVGLMISILSQIVEFRNNESGLHVLHVNTMTRMLLEQVAKKTTRYNLTSRDISLITIASSLHDIGKISIPEDILNKPGRLTEQEFALMKEHSAIGADMLRNLPNYDKEPLIALAYEICRWHHERYDGRGYPDGLKGDEIPISAQVVALADVYDALTSERVYKSAIPHEEAVQMINDGQCGAFDPLLLECFNEIADELYQELKLNSVSSYCDQETDRAMRETLHHEELEPSSRTLDLLEYERTKFNFFAKMSNELQFEYTEDPPLALVKDYSVRKVGLKEVIRNPYEDPELTAMFGEGLQMLHDRLRATTPDEPEVQFDMKAVVQGEPRWFHLAARALWDESDGGLVYNGSIGKLVDIHETRLRMDELQRRATHDSLTDLLNHDFARKLVMEAMSRNPEADFVLMVLDMDHFKEANDTYGHLFGDEVLEHLAGRLRESVRDGDVVARVGGDEFMICMECTADPKPLVERIYNSITGEFRGFPVSVSMGVVCVRGADADYDECFRSADLLLYEMKRAGRGGYAFGGLDRQAEAADGSALSAIDGEKS